MGTNPDLYDWSRAADWPTWSDVGGAGEAGAPLPFTVELNGVRYAVDAAKFKHRTIPSLRDTIVTSGQDDDSLYTSDAAWNRYAYSWHHGAGGRQHDFGQDAEPMRFAYSTGVDPWTPHQLRLNRKLMPDTNQTIRVGDCVFAANGYFYVIDVANDKVWLGRAGTPGNWDSTAYSGQSGTAQCVETFGYRVYLGTSTKIQVSDFVSSFTWTDFTTSPARSWQMLRFVGGRFFGFTSAGEMYEIASDGTATLVYKPIQGSGVSFYWTTCFALGSRIYAGGHDLSVAHLWTFEADATGRLYKGNEAADLPRGETLLCGTSVAGVALLGTNRGIRLVRPAGDGTLEFGPLIGVVADEAVGYSTIVVDGQWAWSIGTDHYGDSCLIRIDLATFTSPLAPAWAHDLALRAGAFVPSTVNGKRTLALRPGSTTTSGKRQFIVGTLLGSTYRVASGCHEEYWTYASITGTYPYDEFGEVVSAPVLFGTIEEKQMHALHVVTDPLAWEQGIGVLVENEGNVDIGSGEVFYDGETPLRGTVLDLHSAEIQQARVTISLQSVGGATTPTLRRWRLRGFPVVPPAEEWELPVSIEETVMTGPGQGQVQSQDVPAMLAELRRLWLTKEPVLFRWGSVRDGDNNNDPGDISARVRVEDFQVVEPPSWTADGNAFQSTVSLRLVTV